MGVKDLVVMSVLYVEYQPHSCTSWASNGSSDLPIMINGGTSMVFGGQNTLEGLFFTDDQIPKRVFIDHELNVHYKYAGYQSVEDIEGIIDEMLENMGDE